MLYGGVLTRGRSFDKLQKLRYIGNTPVIPKYGKIEEGKAGGLY